MNKKSKVTLGIFAFLVFFILLESIYLINNKKMDAEKLEKKIAFVSLVGLPDLAFSSQDSYIRHRSLSDVFSIYKDDSSLREYSKAAFVISHAYTKEEK
ncbi:MAG: hypothetical protein PHU40_02190 [Sulfurimonas sp.]|nr:hypothetical protein [Sulfurimonas sp.]